MLLPYWDDKALPIACLPLINTLLLNTHQAIDFHFSYKLCDEKGRKASLAKDGLEPSQSYHTLLRSALLSNLRHCRC